MFLIIGNICVIGMVMDNSCYSYFKDYKYSHYLWFYGQHWPKKLFSGYGIIEQYFYNWDI